MPEKMIGDHLPPRLPFRFHAVRFLDNVGDVDTLPTYIRNVPPGFSMKRTRTAEQLFTKNLFLVIMLGVLISAWVWWKTEWFVEFAEILALGGVFSWVAFVSRILKDERIKAIQDLADEHIFGNPRTTGILYRLIGAVSLLFFCFLGTVQVESFDSSDRAIEISRSGAAESGNPTAAEVGRLHQGIPVRAVFATFWLWKSQVRVKVQGYPAQYVEVSPWSGSRLYAPTSFLGGAVLVLPDPDLFRRRGSIKIGIKITEEGRQDGKPLPTYRFDGHAFWIGDGNNVAISPQEYGILSDSLKDRIEMKEYWLNPSSPFAVYLAKGACGDVQAFDTVNDVKAASKHFCVKALATYAEFPQTVELKLGVFE